MRERERERETAAALCCFVASRRRRLARRKSIDEFFAVARFNLKLIFLTCVVRIHEDSVSGLVLSVMSSPAGGDIGMRVRTSVGRRSGESIKKAATTTNEGKKKRRRGQR